MDPGRARRRCGQVGPAPPHQRHLNDTSDASFLAGSLSRQASTPRALLDLAFSRPPSFAAGEPGRWEYSNTNYAMLGMIIESITGREVAQVLRQRILEPIGAEATFLDGSEPLVGEVTYGDLFLGTNVATFLHPSASWSAGNVVASIGDLVNWTEMRGNGSFQPARCRPC